MRIFNSSLICQCRSVSRRLVASPNPENIQPSLSLARFLSLILHSGQFRKNGTEIILLSPVLNRHLVANNRLKWQFRAYNPPVESLIPEKPILLCLLFVSY
jgi:hypothetical protein